MKRYPWKQYSRAPLRCWTSSRPNSMKPNAWCGACTGCVEEARRYAALMRLVERKAGGR